MNRILFPFLIVGACLISDRLAAQISNPDLLHKPWKAQWITGPGAPLNAWTAVHDASLKEYGVFKFRKTIELQEKPSSFVVHVSADNRYKLFVNGKQVSQGPARGDLYFWNFETVELGPHLNVGSNTVAAVVWNDGSYKPEAQISHLTAFILQGNTKREEILNSDNTWKCVKDESYHPLRVRVPGYYVAGPGEYVDMGKYVKDWEKKGHDDSSWGQARAITAGLPKRAAVNSTGWMLVPSTIPQMEMTIQRLGRVRKAEGIQVPPSFPAAKAKLTIPPNSRSTILLDQGFLTNAYPTLILSGGKGAGLSLAYAEGLYVGDEKKSSGVYMPLFPKGNRNEIEGKFFIGKKDSVVSDGTVGQEYTPLWWRTYRYIKLSIQTRNEPLTIEDLYGTFTGYPFVQNAKLQTSNHEMGTMLDIGWRTARLCAFETYMDCPYYEQLQYIGDARIQALVSYYNAGDDRLARHGLTLMDHSRIAEGITLSRYPTDLDQQIPTFSLWYIGMLHDYYMYRPDSLFVKEKLPGARQILSFFEEYQTDDGSLQNVPYWVFTDWAEGTGWDFGMAPKGSKGESAILDVQLMWTYQVASELEEQLGLNDLAVLYTNRAEQLKKAFKKKYWDAGRNLFADTEEKNTFSQHVNSLAILANVVSGEDAGRLAKLLLADTTMVPASIYFKFYLHQALTKAGLGNDYLKWLDKWRENIRLGMTTWAEDSDIDSARSDCHAWGSSPNVEFFRTVLGIESDAPGFSKVRIQPHLGDIKDISGEMPHPNGRISVVYRLKKGKLEGEIILPENTTGIFLWNDKRVTLASGKNSLRL
jgi:alpha-L-rhamnosidase